MFWWGNFDFVFWRPYFVNWSWIATDLWTMQEFVNGTKQNKVWCDDFNAMLLIGNEICYFISRTQLNRHSIPKKVAKKTFFAKENGCRPISISSENQPHHFVVVLLPVNYSWYMSRIHHYEQRTLPPPTFSHIFRRLTICRNWAEGNRVKKLLLSYTLLQFSMKFNEVFWATYIYPLSSFFTSAIIMPLSINLVSCSTRLSHRETWFSNVLQ